MVSLSCTRILWMAFRIRLRKKYNIIFLLNHVYDYQRLPKTLFRYFSPHVSNTSMSTDFKETFFCGFPVQLMLIEEGIGSGIEACIEERNGQVTCPQMKGDGRFYGLTVDSVTVYERSLLVCESLQTFLAKLTCLT